MKAIHFQLIMLSGLLLCSSGCVHVSKYSMVRFWADWNSYGTPTFFCERTDHLPPYNPRVQYYRWMYGQGPGDTPVVVHQKQYNGETIISSPEPAPASELPVRPNFDAEKPVEDPRDSLPSVPDESLPPLPPAPTTQQNGNNEKQGVAIDTVGFNRQAVNNSRTNLLRGRFEQSTPQSGSSGIRRSRVSDNPSQWQTNGR